MSDRPQTYLLTLTAAGAGPPAEVRLRRALKWLLRSFGLKCVKVEPAVAASHEGPERYTACVPSQRVQKRG